MPYLNYRQTMPVPYAFEKKTPNGKKIFRAKDQHHEDLRIGRLVVQETTICSDRLLIETFHENEEPHERYMLDANELKQGEAIEEYGYARRVEKMFQDNLLDGKFREKTTTFEMTGQYANGKKIGHWHTSYTSSKHVEDKYYAQDGSEKHVVVTYNDKGNEAVYNGMMGISDNGTHYRYTCNGDECIKEMETFLLMYFENEKLAAKTREDGKAFQEARRKFSELGGYLRPSC